MSNAGTHKLEGKRIAIRHRYASIPPYRMRLVECRWILASLGFIALISWLNRFPDGMIFAGGDIFQIFDRQFVERNFRHIWSNLLGEGSFSSGFLYYPFYAVLLTVAEVLGLAPSQQSMLYTLGFWGGAYATCLLALSWLTEERLGLRSLETSLLALFYAINPFAFYAFYFIWGYSPFLILYVVFPIIAAATLKFFGERSWRRTWQYLPVFFISHLCATVAYANLPFFIALNIVLLGLVLFEWLLGPRREPGTFVLKGLAYIAVELAATGWAVLPQLPHLLFEKYLVSADDFSNWILWQRMSFWELFTFNPTAAPYLDTSRATVIALLPVGIALWVLIGWKDKRSSHLHRRSIALAVVVAAIILIESKGKGIVPDAVAIWAFSNPVLGALRSIGKVVIFLPFLVILMVWGGTSSRPRFTRLVLLWAIVASSAIAGHPMLMGQLQTKFSVSLKDGEDCDSAEYCYLNRIPPEYAAAAKAIDGDGLRGKILSLPYSVINSAGWSNYPPWKHVGADPTVQLFSLPVVQMNSYDLFGRPYGLEWIARGGVDPEWITNLAADLGVSYFIFHRDVARDFIYPAALYLSEYEKMGLLSMLYDSPIISVYRVSDAYLRPALTIHTNRLSAAPLPTVDMKKLSPAKYVATLNLDAEETSLVLREGFSSLWRVHILPADGIGPAQELAQNMFWWQSFLLPALSDDAHSRFAGYGNVWRLDRSMLCRRFGCAMDKRGVQSVSLVVEYAPQRYVYLLQALTVVSGIVAAIAVLIFRVRSARRSEAQE